MSWSRSIAHTSKDDATTQLKSLRGDHIPADVVDLIQRQLDKLPEGSQVTISTYGHFWGDSQTGQCSAHFQIDVQAPPPDPEAK